MWTVGVNCYLHNQWVDGDLPGRATTRAEDAALQVGGVSPALPLDPSSGPQHLRSPAPPRLSPHPPSVPSRGRPCVADRVVVAVQRGLSRWRLAGRAWSS